MSTLKLKLVSQEDCGCRNFIDGRGREIIDQCVACRALSDAHHRASVEHVHRALMASTVAA
jgi:hypothetical protein